MSRAYPPEGRVRSQNGLLSSSGRKDTNLSLTFFDANERLLRSSNFAGSAAPCRSGGNRLSPAGRWHGIVGWPQRRGGLRLSHEALGAADGPKNHAVGRSRDLQGCDKAHLDAGRNDEGDRFQGWRFDAADGEAGRTGALGARGATVRRVQVHQVHPVLPAPFPLLLSLLTDRGTRREPQTTRGEAMSSEARDHGAPASVRTARRSSPYRRRRVSGPSRRAMRACATDAPAPRIGQHTRSKRARPGRGGRGHSRRPTFLKGGEPAKTDVEEPEGGLFALGQPAEEVARHIVLRFAHRSRC